MGGPDGRGPGVHTLRPYGPGHAPQGPVEPFHGVALVVLGLGPLDLAAQIPQQPPGGSGHEPLY